MAQEDPFERQRIADEQRRNDERFNAQIQTRQSLNQSYQKLLDLQRQGVHGPGVPFEGRMWYRTVWSHGISDDMKKSLNKLAASAEVVTGLGFTHGGFAVTYEPNGYWVRSAPPALLEALSAVNRAKDQVKTMSVEGDRWVVVQPHAYRLGGPNQRLLDAALGAVDEKKTPLKSIGLFPNGGYVLLWGWGEWKSQNVPDSLVAALQDANKQRKRIDRVIATPRGGWLVVCDGYYAAWDKVPATMVPVLREIGAQQDRMIAVAFGPNDSWAIVGWK